MEFKINEFILEYERKTAYEIKKFFTQIGSLIVNIISSPGAGKTTLIEKTIDFMKEKYKIFVIEGDVETERDAERIKKKGIEALQITTGGACHLEASMIAKKLKNYKFKEKNYDFIFIENVGNLVCPASFYLGEHLRTVMISVPEGDDKPKKYPKIFLTSQIFLISKIDLLPYFDFKIEKVKKEALELNPKLQIIEISAKTGENIDKWIKILEEKRKEILCTNSQL